MIAEILHLCRHAPATLALKRRLPQDQLYATLIERADRAGLAARRRALVDDLRGTVVEVGCGTGAMFAHYRPTARVIAIEPDDAFAAHARRAARVARASSVEVLVARGEALPLATASCDAAVIALVLCSVPDPNALCREVARVVRPGGVVRLIEHVRSERPLARRLMTALDPLWLRVNGQGCHMDRDPLPAITSAGLRIEAVDAFQVWSAGIPAFPMRAIRAVRSAMVTG